jgi:hypothetical protein
MNENWYDLVHEANEDGESYLGPTVLYTSHQGLSNLAGALQRISSLRQLGRFSLDMPDMDEDCYAPFTHVEVAESPVEKVSDTKKNSKTMYWVLGVLVGLPLLALYGAIRLVLDIIR